jgi:hypothetical protein
MVRTLDIEENILYNAHNAVKLLVIIWICYLSVLCVIKAIRVMNDKVRVSDGICKKRNS